LSSPDPVRSSTAGVPGRSAAQIRADIEAQRQEFGTSVEALRFRVAELTDWRRQVAEHRGQIVTGAAVAGFVVGVMALRRRKKRRG
jgi:hypothetical protein